MSVKSALAAACMAALVAGCAASAPSGTAELPAQTAPAAQRQPALKSPGPHRARLVIRIRIPRRHRGHYVSAATKGMTLALTGPTTTTESIGLTPASDPRCTGATTVACTISVGLLSGQYTATISTYDEAPVNGAIPPNANLLSTAKNVPFTIQPGIANTISFTLAGQIASLTVAALPSGTIGTAFATRFPFTVEAMDADGYIIVGSYESPVTLSTSDTTGATAVTTSGSDSPPAGTLLSSWDVPYLNYTGAGIVPATISASATGATTGSGVFAPSPVLTAIGTTIGSAGAGVSETLTGHFAPGAMTVSVSGSGVTVSNVASTATQVTANFFIDPEAATGSRNVTVQVTGGGTSGAQGFTISNTGVVVVTLATDANPGTPPGTGTGTSGDLRYALLNAAAGDTIVFNTAAMCGASQCTITLGGPLPPIRQNQIIDGGEFGRVTIDGNSLYARFGSIRERSRSPISRFKTSMLRAVTAVATGTAEAAGEPGSGAAFSSTVAARTSPSSTIIS